MSAMWWPKSCWERLGVEPLGEQFDVKAFAQTLKKRKGPIKQVLLAGGCGGGASAISMPRKPLFLSAIRPDHAGPATEPRTYHSFTRGGAAMCWPGQ